MPSTREARGPRVRRPGLTPGARATLVSWASVALALLALVWSLSQQEFLISAAVCFLLAAGCLVVISGVTTTQIGVGLVALFCLTASWDQVRIGVNARMLFLALGLMLLAPNLDLKRIPPVPWWLHAYGFAAVLATSLQLVSPVAQSYLDGRYATSASGRSLGERAGALGSVASLLFNNYAIPVILVFTCMCMPKALRWLVGAYVAGAAFSSLAAIGGYYGHPQILDALNGLPIPSGQRAAGLTSHPLRLATSEVMSIALAVWLVVQPRRSLKLVGVGGVPLLLVGLYVSGSRGGMVAGMIVTILCTFMLPAVRRRFHVVVGSAGIAILGFFFLFPAALDGLLGSTRLSGDTTTAVSDTGRSEVFQQGLHDFNHSPIWGIGIQFIAEAHTLYLGVLAAGGVILGLGFLLFNVGLLKATYEAMTVDRALGGALLATIIASLWYWTVADLIQTATVATVYGFVAALWWMTRQGMAVDPPEPGREVDLRERPAPAVFGAR